MTHITITLPDDPIAARDALAERLAQIAGEQAELTALLNDLSIPTSHAGRPLDFHQRVAVMSGFYEATLEALG